MVGGFACYADGTDISNILISVCFFFFEKKINKQKRKTFETQFKSIYQMDLIKKQRWSVTMAKAG